MEKNKFKSQNKIKHFFETILKCKISFVENIPAIFQQYYPPK